MPHEISKTIVKSIIKFTPLDNFTMWDSKNLIWGISNGVNKYKKIDSQRICPRVCVNGMIGHLGFEILFDISPDLSGRIFGIYHNFPFWFWFTLRPDCFRDYGERACPG